MRIEAVIAVVFDEEHGTSNKGNAWRSRELLLTWDDETNDPAWRRKQYLCVRLTGPSLELFDQRGLKQGDTVRGLLMCDTHKGSNNRQFNQIVLWMD